MMPDYSQKQRHTIKFEQLIKKNENRDEKLLALFTQLKTFVDEKEYLLVDVNQVAPTQGVIGGWRIRNRNALAPITITFNSALSLLLGYGGENHRFEYVKGPDNAPNGGYIYLYKNTTLEASSVLFTKTPRAMILECNIAKLYNMPGYVNPTRNPDLLIFDKEITIEDGVKVYYYEPRHLNYCDVTRETIDEIRFNFKSLAGQPLHFFKGEAASEWKYRTEIGVHFKPVTDDELYVIDVVPVERGVTIAEVNEAAGFHDIFA
jgi:hypothetical protein